MFCCRYVTKFIYVYIGPRSTKCLLKEQVHHMDVENYVTQVITTQTPDVPSGSSFCVKTRICIMRAGHGKVRVLVTMVVEFTKSSWLKCKFFFFFVSFYPDSFDRYMNWRNNKN